MLDAPVLTDTKRRARPGRPGTMAMIVACLAFAAGCSSGSPSSGTSAGIQWSPAGTIGTKPTVVVPSGSPPSTLLTRDLIVGSGATAQAGDTVTVQYVGYSWTTKQQFDASWDRGQPFVFPLGAHRVIAGWDEGVAGMKVGGRRELVIPPNLAYGSTSPGSGIAPNDTLVFVVDLVKVG